MISRILIENFKQISRLECDLESFNIIVGANNSGKSSILQAIGLLVSLIQSRQLLKGAERTRFALAAHQLLYTPLHPLPAVKPLTADLETATQIGVTLRGPSGTTQEVAATLRFRSDEGVDVEVANPQAMDALQDILKPYAVHLTGLTRLAKVENYAGVGALRRAVARGQLNEHLRNALRELRGEKIRWQAFESSLREVIPNLVIDVAFDDQVDEHVAAAFIQDGKTLPLESAGTGTLQAVEILAYAHLFEPRVLLLDEPDSHLHPDNQRNIIRALWRLSEKGSTQVICTTHSRHVLDAKPDLAKLIVVANGAYVAGADAEPITLLMELGALNDAERLQSGRIRCVVATEDKNTDEIANLIYSSGFVEDETIVCSYAGCSKADSAAVLATFTRRYAPGVSLVVHRDRDFLPDGDLAQFKKDLEKLGIYVFITKGSDVESHYLNENHIVAAEPRITSEEATDALARAFEAAKPESKKVLIRCRTDHAFKERNKKSGRGKYPDVGEIAEICHKDVDRDPKGFADGKHTLGLLKSELQALLGENPNLYKRTAALTDPDLKAIAAKIWPAPEPQTRPSDATKPGS